jgi:hypothetical protein
MSRTTTLALTVACLLLLPLGVGCSGEPTSGVENFSLAPSYQQTYPLTFPAGKRVTIDVRSNGSSDVDLFVHDQYGNLVAADESPSPHCRVQFIPASTQVYQVRVVNRVLVDAPHRNGPNSGTLRWRVQ